MKRGYLRTALLGLSLPLLLSNAPQPWPFGNHYSTDFENPEIALKDLTYVKKEDGTSLLSGTFINESDKVLSEASIVINRTVDERKYYDSYYIFKAVVERPFKVQEPTPSIYCDSFFPYALAIGASTTFELTFERPFDEGEKETVLKGIKADAHSFSDRETMTSVFVKGMRFHTQSENGASYYLDFDVTSDNDKRIDSIKFYYADELGRVSVAYTDDHLGKYIKDTESFHNVLVTFMGLEKSDLTPQDISTEAMISPSYYDRSSKHQAPYIGLMLPIVLVLIFGVAAPLICLTVYFIRKRKKGNA